MFVFQLYQHVGANFLQYTVLQK